MTAMLHAMTVSTRTGRPRRKTVYITAARAASSSSHTQPLEVKQSMPEKATVRMNEMRMPLADFCRYSSCRHQMKTHTVTAAYISTPTL